jgi:BlaI family transcriptional regulator, penicillinase repressor
MSRRKQRSARASGDEAPLPEAELEVLACLHRYGELEARELREHMAGYRPMAHPSMMTLLKRLEDRGLVTRRRAPTGKAFIYSATEEAAATYRGVVRRLLERVFGNDSLMLVSSLFDVKEPTRREVDELRALLDDLHEGPPGGKEKR